MADVILTLKIMPESPEIDLNSLAEQIKSKITEYAGEGEIKTEEEPIAFGLKALKLTFVADEEKGSTDSLEEGIKNIEGVNSCEVVDVRRAIG